MKLIKKGVSADLFTVLFCIFLFQFANSKAQAQEQPAALESLTEKFEEGSVLHSVFEHKVIDSFTNDTTLQRGEIWLTANAYKIRTETTTLLVDGEISRVFDKLKNRMIISEYDPAEDDFAPSQLLTDVQSRYNSAVEETKDDLTVIILQSDDIFSTFKKIEIYLNEKQVPQKIVAVDQVDNHLSTTFNNPVFMSSLPGMFQIPYPDDAEIVDLRP